jgi:ethanolamine ammonia-lyase large subunit
VNFVMGVPGADDIMLNYQSTSFHDALYVSRVLGLRRAPEFEAWLARMDITDARGELRAPAQSAMLLRQLSEVKAGDLASGEVDAGDPGPTTGQAP